MYFIHCAFDRKRELPLYAVVFDSEEKDIDFYPLYLKSGKTKLYEVEQNFKTIKGILCDYKVVVSGFKDYVKCFKLNHLEKHQVYDAPGLPIRGVAEVVPMKKLLIEGLKKFLGCEALLWNKVLADSQFVYSHLETAGYWQDKARNPTYEFAYTGRSKSIGDNIQGASTGAEIYSNNVRHDTFVCFDWIAADLRAASILSQDVQLKNSFIESDPYTHLQQQLASSEITREDCKLELFRSFYSINYENPILEIYPDFAKWMKETSDKIEEQGYSESILNRKFTIEKERTKKSCFNAQVQGSVAHAMQNTIYRVFKAYPQNLMAEIHDSLVLSCPAKAVDEIIQTVSKIMLKPFEGILQSSPTFPIKVLKGKKWKMWEEVAEFR
tara:strand:- start:71689 stop:72834 length:1146 start_codon:yes stop_codon:yes gene_type:complete